MILISDLSDKRASVRVDGGVHEGLKLTVPSVLATWSGVSRLGSIFLAAYPFLSILVDALSSVAGLVGAVYIISSTVPNPSSLIADRLQYRYGQFLRRCAKIALPPLLLLALYGLWRAAPVGLAKHDRLAGFVCSTSDGGPIPNANVSVLNERGALISTPAFPTDSTGYFIARLNWWANSPASISISVPGSLEVKTRIDDYATNNVNGCRLTMAIPDARHATKAWYVKLSGRPTNP